MPLIDLRRARADVRLGEVLELLGWVARVRVGVQVRGPCPVHGSASATSRVFSAHLGRGVWQCFRCGASGNTLDLWARVTGRGIYDAVRELYQRLGRAVPWLGSPREKERGAMHDP
jgi:DNA primase